MVHNVSTGGEQLTELTEQKITQNRIDSINIINFSALVILILPLHKTAELSQRRPRDAPNIWVHWKVLRVLTTHPTTFPEICNGLLFRSILRMCVQNLKFVALPVPEIIGGTQKIWAVPGYAHAPFSPKILKRFCSDGCCEYTCQIWSS